MDHTRHDTWGFIAVRSRLATAALIGVGALGLMAPAHAEPTPLPHVEGVPILARTMIGNSTSNPPPNAVLSVHGVRRLEGASVIYFSMGIPEGSPAPDSVSLGAYGTGFFNVLSQQPGAGSVQCSAAALDIAGGLAYTALRKSGGNRCFGTDSLDFGTDSKTGPHAAVVGYAVIAPIPEQLDTVGLYLGNHIFHDLPVEDGPMEPLNTTNEVVVVGTGWPKVDLSVLSEAVDPAKAVMPLRTMVTDRTAKVSQTQKTVEIDASVLFAVDKSVLTPKATAVIAQAAAKVKAAAPSGTIQVEGHTDSNAGDAYNLKLSQARAAAVAAALKKQLPGYTIKAVGKGETEPIATNSTDAGRALNRRVTITLPK